MKRLLLVLLAFSCVGVAVYLSYSGGPKPAYETAKAVEIGSPAPDFQLEDTEGNKISLSALRGKVVLVNFWATWCPPCRAEMPSMAKLNELMSDEDFVILAINVEENGRSSVPPFLQQNPHDFPILYDDQGVVQKLYGVYRFPESFVVLKDGVIDDKVVGAIDWAHPDTVAYFKDLTKG